MQHSCSAELITVVVYLLMAAAYASLLPLSLDVLLTRIGEDCHAAIFNLRS